MLLLFIPLIQIICAVKTPVKVHKVIDTYKNSSLQVNDKKQSPYKLVGQITGVLYET